jgi:tetratricopeptide (TPR) repeat protein
MDEFRLSGALVADRCEKFFTSLGIEPTAADILGLATHIAANEKDIENLTLLGYNPRTDGTFITIGRTEREIAAEVISNTAVETSREDLVYQYWQSREAGTAVPLFTELTTPIESVGVPIDRTKNDLRVTPSIILANRIETEQPADRVIAAKGSMIVAISGDGTSTTPRDFRYNESSAIVGATGGSVDVRNKKTGEFVMAQEVVKVTGSTHHREKSDTVEEIMALSERTKNMAKKIAEVYDTDEEKLRAIFELVRDGGELGIEASMYLQDRPKGSKTVAEVIRTKQANCLESTLAYLAVAKEVFVDRGDIAVIPLNIVSINKRISVGHASVGVLTTANGFVGDNRFDTDAKFRRAVLEATGFEDSADLKFVIIDPVNRLFDYRFATTVPLNKAQIVSYFKTNSANYALRRKDEELAEKEFKKALEFWPTNPIVLRHTAYAMASDGKYGHALDEIRKIAEDQRDSAYYRAEMEIWTRQLFEVKERDPNKFQRLCVLAEQAVDKAINCDKANDQAWRLKEMLTRAGGQGKNAKKVRSKRIRSIKQERKAVGLNLRTSSHARGVGIDTRENNKERIELGLRY